MSFCNIFIFASAVKSSAKSQPSITTCPRMVWGLFEMVSFVIFIVLNQHPYNIFPISVDIVASTLFCNKDIK